MRHREADIERGIAEMDDFMVQQNQFVLPDEHVFGAVIPVDDGEPTGAGLFDQTHQEMPRGRYLAGRKGIVRLQPEGFEKRSIIEYSGKRITPPVRICMHNSK